MTITDAQKLTPEQQRVVLARWRGYEILQSDGRFPMGGLPGEDWTHLPDYATSLDALAEIETGLSEEEWLRYIETLYEMFGMNWAIHLTEKMKTLLTVKAGQRAVALIVTLSKQHPTE